MHRLAVHSEKLIETITQENFQRKLGEGLPVLVRTD